ncbi:MAG TPA: J domain-containing protein [Candidatus Limnocylindrales bacterium]|nr:J domain-containing protein [Candidatus Limnocylindrales bacterium]
MPEQRFRGDPYQVLGIAHGSSDASIKRRWRELAREHHPDRAAGDAEEAARLTSRMARINSAYDLLRDPVRRAAWDTSPAGRRAREAAADAGIRFDDDVEFDASGPSGPPPPPRTPPVTARFDTTAAFRPRNARTGERQGELRGHQPLNRRRFETERDLRASTPTGPVERRRGERAMPLPTLQEARETTLEFGRFHGYTLGEVELLEPTYIDWVARTITRDRELVVKARIIQAELDQQGVNRRSGPQAPGFGTRAAAG